jgi:hypothetical protein
MLSAAYALVGLRIEKGHVVLPDDLFEPRGDLRIRSVCIRGRRYSAPSNQEDEISTAAQ